MVNVYRTRGRNCPAGAWRTIMNVAVINLSAPHYNLGCAKLATWLRAEGNEVEEFKGDPGLFLHGFDLVCVSAIFSWDVPKVVQVARRAECEVWAGGPGF